MKLLIVNKFLYPRGGAETYVHALGAQYEKTGHTVAYFGMRDGRNTLGNPFGLYAEYKDFHEGSSLLQKAAYPLSVLYSRDAYKKFSALLSAFAPDVILVNNFNFQLTPSILVAADAYKKTHPAARVVYIAHDSQLVCPAHLMYDPKTRTPCDACLGGHYRSCVRRACIHGSRLRSALGMLEAYYWHKRNIYGVFDAVICPSSYMKQALDSDPVLADRTVVLRNFADRYPHVDRVEAPFDLPPRYVLYFGRYAEEKGLRTLCAVCRAHPEIPFVFAGAGPLSPLLAGIPNVTDVGFLSGDALHAVIGGAEFTVYPSEWSENCPFSVMESIMAGVPVIGSDSGGIPELIEHQKTGIIFPTGHTDALSQAVVTMWEKADLEVMRASCRAVSFDSLPRYAEALLSLIF